MAEIGYAEEQISYELYVQWIRFASSRPASRWIGIELYWIDKQRHREGKEWNRWAWPRKGIEWRRTGTELV